MSITDNEILAFKAISEYIHDLAEIFSAKQHSLKLYSHLITKTTLSHSSAIRKNIDAFRAFCVDNREVIFEKNFKPLVNPFITYSDNAFIDMKQIFELADNDTKNVIMKHLLVISALVDPAGRAKEILKKNVTKGKEGDFLSNIIDKVEKNVDPNSNPMEAVSSILKSGVFTELISGMNDGLKDGTLDLGSLMNSVQSMVGGLTQNANTSDESKQMMNNMMSTMMSGLTKPSDSEDGSAPPAMPDIMSMLGTLGGSGLLGESKTIEEKINEQVAEMKQRKPAKKELDEYPKIDEMD